LVRKNNNIQDQDLSIIIVVLQTMTEEWKDLPLIKERSFSNFPTFFTFESHNTESEYCDVIYRHATFKEA